jgi:putative membrane protein
MAVAVGIYQRLLDGIASIDAEALRRLAKLKLADTLARVHWRFLGCLGLGIGLGIVLMLKVVRLPHLLETTPKFVYAVFFGLVLASCLVLTRRASSWGPRQIVMAVLGTAAGFAVVNLVPVSTPDAGWFIFLCGAVAICAMLLPGISGSFVLLILGKYELMMNAVSGLLHLDLSQLSVVVPFGLGCLVGIAAFSRFLGWLLRRWHDPVLAFLIGLLFGSLWRIWPYQELKTVIVRDKPRVVEAIPFWPESFEVSVLLLMIAGLAIVFTIEIVAARRRSAVALVRA